jgi:ERF superfamily
MQSSDEINEIAAALAKAQGVIKNPAKTRENPHFKSTYADLAMGLNSIRPALSGFGIAIVQATDINRDGVILITRLIHGASGQYIGCIYPVASASTDHQKLGAALTYAKRQALFSLVGICGEDEDDDGEGIKGKGNGIDDAFVSDMQIAELRAKIADVGADEQRFLRFLKVGGFAVMPAREFDRAMSELNRKVPK